MSTTPWELHEKIAGSLGPWAGRWLWEVDGIGMEVERKTGVWVSSRAEAEKTAL